jgi:alkylation response protein AidB-like acyl-CoA dehydrogenase
VRGVERLDGDEGFAEVFFDDVFVSDDDVLGEPNKGWEVAMATTGSERGLTLRSPGRFLATAQRLIDLWHTHGEDPEIRDRLITAYIDAEAYRWQTYWTVTQLVEGGRTGAESSMVKVFWSELDVRLHELALETLGRHAQLVDGDDAAWMKGYQFALAGPIYAGTNEIQRNVVAERVLGLPRK